MGMPIVQLTCLLILFFLPGLCILFFRLLKKINKRKATIIGLISSGFALALIVLYFFYQVLFDLFALKPNQKDIVGKYHSVSYKYLDQDGFHSYRNGPNMILELKRDSSFNLSGQKCDLVESCENGRYKIDYQSKGNEIAFKCDSCAVYAHIDRKIAGYGIEISYEDGDGREYIYFEKIKK